MIKALTSDIAKRFLGGFAVGCAIVLAGSTGLFNGIA